ncbi:MAG: NAD-dependent epimerase/dehydratase family protein [Sulfitobacter sp.]|nr:NAD-dependent epimerase/dehydratase family protein [Sulfitobacter sp.]
MPEPVKPCALVTGSSGFIGAAISHALLDAGWQIIGIDSMNDYYDVTLKEARRERLTARDGFSDVIEKIESPGVMADLFARHRPRIVIHLAAQAGVRYSIENPRAYFEANLGGTFELLEAARAYPPKHMLLASTSSAYGANTDMPYRETDRADHQMSFYAATKKGCESMAHSYAHLYGMPITMFRFFTVYGPWGRPDMAHFKFTDRILKGEPIEVYNHGDMKRDFTYISDLVQALMLLVDRAPGSDPVGPNDSLSPVAPFRVLNIGNSEAVPLLDFIAAIEAATGKTSKQTLMAIQPGDVPATWADASLLKSLTGYQPGTDIRKGVAAFVDWYRGFYGV